MSNLASLSAQLEKLAGSDRVRVSEDALQEFAIGGRSPMAVLQPRSAEEVSRIVGFAAAEKLAVVPCGSRSKLEMGMPPERYDLVLDMTELRRIAHYDPGDLTVSVDAGMPLNELATALAVKKQFLPLAVPCNATSTVGGAIASGIDSTLRQQYGTARDFLIGAEFVDGTGKQCKSGGRVVKNVTGYDLHKLLIGSLGTLGVITRLNFRTFPLPELRSAYFSSFSTIEAAMNFHALLLKSGLPFSNLELFDSHFASLLATAMNKLGENTEGLRTSGWDVFVTFEGNAAVIKRVEQELQQRSGEAQAVCGETLHSPITELVNDALRKSFDWLRGAAPSVALLRIVLPKIGSGDVAELVNLSQEPSMRATFLLRACGVVYLVLLAESEDTAAKAALERRVTRLLSHVEAKHGTATMLHAPDWLKHRVNVWGAKRADFPMMQRVKQAFDPQNICAPGRFVGGI